MKHKLVAAVFSLLLLPVSGLSQSSMCLYTTSDGKFIQVNSMTEVPPEYLSQASCFNEKKHVPPKTPPPKSAKLSEETLGLTEALKQLIKQQPPGTKIIPPKLYSHTPGDTNLALPQDIELEGNIRRESISSPIGTIELRWPRSVESLFGRTPLRAMAEAARTVSRAIRTSAFPTEVQTLSVDWKVVFMDNNMPGHQIPANLIKNCHPGWMTPPGNIYIVAQRVAGDCGQGGKTKPSVADGDLAEVLVHELAHAVDFHILGREFYRDRMRAEGFATWFEMYASDYSSMISRSEIVARTSELARRSFQLQPNNFRFTGDGPSYARASMYYRAISEKRGVRGVMKVQKLIRDEGLSFFPAVRKAVRWNRSQLEREAAKVADKG